MAHTSQDMKFSDIPCVIHKLSAPKYISETCNFYLHSISQPPILLCDITIPKTKSNQQRSAVQICIVVVWWRTHTAPVRKMMFIYLFTSLLRPVANVRYLSHVIFANQSIGSKSFSLAFHRRRCIRKSSLKHESSCICDDVYHRQCPPKIEGEQCDPECILPPTIYATTFTCANLITGV